MPTQTYDPAFPVSKLLEHPDNPRRGDEAAIEASMRAHGFYGAVLAQTSTRQIIAGNHRTRVARKRGEATVPVLFLDVDDEQARRILLVDNRTNDLAEYDTSALAAILQELSGTDDLLAGTGFNPKDLQELLEELSHSDPDPDLPVVGDERYTPAWVFEGLDLLFDLDVAAPVEVSQRRTPAKRYLTVRDDGLATPWEGLVWMNPPYSQAAAWAQRWLDHPDGVCLMPLSKARWLPELLEAADAAVITPLVTFDVVSDQTGQITFCTFLAARGAGVPGVHRIAELHNWPVLTSRPRPRAGEPLHFGPWG